MFNGTFDAVAIDATHLKLIEMDPTATLSGDAYSQTSPTIATGTLAFTLAGSEVAIGGLMTTNGSGGITGTEDYNVEGTTVSSQTSPAPFGGAYAVDPTNAGRFTLTNFTTFEGGSAYAAYPSSGGVLLLEIDSVGITVGAAYPQTAGAAFAASQGYGMNLSGINLAALGSAVEVDDIAEFTAASGGTLSAGIIDENWAPGNGSPTLGVALSSGTYATIGSGGRYGISATAGNNTTSTLLGGFTLTFYAVDGTTFPFMEIDGGQVSTGVIVLQTPSSSSSSAIAHSNMFVVRPLIHPHAAHQKKN